MCNISIMAIAILNIIVVYKCPIHWPILSQCLLHLNHCALHSRTKHTCPSRTIC
jgi:hypothetical protein